VRHGDLHRGEIVVPKMSALDFCLRKGLLIDYEKVHCELDCVVDRTLIRETHHCTFIAVVCTLRPTSVPIMNYPNTVVLAAIATISATLSKLWWL
jgi:hypothetical protein